MQIKNINISGKAANMIRALCAAACAVMGIIGIAVYGVSPFRMLIAFAFLLIYVELPGLAVLRLLGIKNCRISVTLMFGLFAGWSLEVLAYFINDAIPTDAVLLLAGPLLSAFYIYDHIRRKENPVKASGFRFSRLSLSLVIFATLVMLYCSLSVQYRYLSPELADYTLMNSDKAYHLGLINALSHDYPLVSPWVSGRTITYHVFSEILLSIPVRLFDVPSDFMMLSFGPVFTAFTFCLSVYAFFREMAGAKERAGFYSLLLLLSNIYITRDAYTSLAFKFVLENDNASGYGISAVLATVVAFKKWYDAFKEKSPERWPLLALLTAFIMLTTGIKGPMGAVLVAAAWGTLLLGIILRKVSPKAFIPLAALTAGFVLVYTTVLSGRGVSNASGDSIFALATVTDIAFWKKPLVAAMQAAGIPSPVRLAVVLLVFMAFFFTIYLVPFILGYVRELALVLSGRKEFDPPRVLVYAACLVGFILLMVMNYSGHSQVYFGLVTAFLSPVVAYWFIEDMEAKRDESKPAMHALRISVSMMAVCLAATIISYGMYMGEDLEGAVRASDPHRKHGKYMSISNDEYKAMRWIEANTEEDSLLATDRYYSVSLKKYSVANRWDNRFFLYAVYSNRSTYISGSGYNIPDREAELRREMINTNMQLYDASNEKRGDLARELGVDYVVVSKRFTDAGDLANKDYELCYSSEDIDIYRIAG